MEEVKNIIFSVQITDVLDVLADFRLVGEKVVSVQYEEEIAHIEILR